MGYEFFNHDHKKLQSLLFSSGELRQILSAYGEGVLNKGWKDYAISALSDKSVFSVVDHMAGSATNALYSLSKNKSRQKKGACFFLIHHREKQLFRSESFLEALSTFRCLDRKGSKPGEIIRLIE